MPFKQLESFMSTPITHTTISSQLFAISNSIEDKKVALASYSDSPEVLATMQDFLVYNKPRFAKLFPHFEPDIQKKIIDHLMSKVRIGELVMTLKANPEEKQEYVNALYLALTDEDCQRFIQSHVTNEIEIVAGELLLITSANIAKMYTPNVTATLFKEVIKQNINKLSRPPILIAWIAHYQNWVKNNLANYTQQEQKVIFSCGSASLKTHVITVDKTPESAANKLTSLFPLLGADCNQVLSTLITLHYPEPTLLFQWLNAINSSEVLSAIFYPLIRQRYEDFLFNCQDHAMRNKIFYAVKPVKEPVQTVSAEVAELLFYNAPLLINDSDISNPPTLITIISDLKNAPEGETLSYEKALQQVPLILIALAFNHAELRKQLSPYFYLLTESQMRAVAATLRNNDLPNFVKETAQFFDIYYNALPQATLLVQANELQASFQETRLHEMAREIKQRYQHLKPMHATLIQVAKADWSQYTNEYVDLSHLRNTFTRLLCQTIIHFSRYERIQLHLNLPHPYSHLRKILTDFRIEFCEVASPNFLDTSHIKPPAETIDWN